MASDAHQRLLNALANELENIGVRVTHLARSGMREPFDIQYRDLPEPPPGGGKIPDLQGERWGSIHLGKAEASVYSSRIGSHLATLVRHVVSNPSVSLHVAVPFDRKINTRNTILPMVGPNASSKIWVWPFHKVGQTYAMDLKLRVG